MPALDIDFLYGDQQIMQAIHPPSAAKIEAAYSRIDPVFLDTPLLNHPAADTLLPCQLFCKVESLNPTRSFKGRGTDWFMANLPPGEQPLVAASAGNFGQGLAYAARKHGRKLTMFAATNANPLKITAMRGFGADIVLNGADFDAAKTAARAFGARTGARYVEDGADPHIAEGAGTMALEITRALAKRALQIDTILVPLGNGALLTGIGTWMRAHAPQCRVIGIVAAVAPAMQLSWQQREPVATEQAPTIADGIAVREPVPYALDCMRDTVDDVWSVSETSLTAAMQFCHLHYGLVVEPAGAAGVAAVLEQGSKLQGQRVATILCGGNLTPEQMRIYLA
jgi:threonine dehydratase